MSVTGSKAIINAASPGDSRASRLACIVAGALAGCMGEAFGLPIGASLGAAVATQFAATVLLVDFSAQS